MQATINNRTIELVQGDITAQQVDAIVNAANSRLAGGGGVDGAIHRGGGPAIKQETDRHYPDGCPTGSAVISGAGELPARFVIHAVGPVYGGGQKGEQKMLAGAYRRSLELATENNCATIALPSLSTGAYRYPLEEACHVALGTAIEYLKELTENQTPRTVRFVLFGNDPLAVFRESLAKLIS